MTITDPQQAKMMKLMPVSMAVMFVVFPFSSGLALYILTSSLVGILQQWYLNRRTLFLPRSNPSTPRVRDGVIAQSAWVKSEVSRVL